MMNASQYKESLKKLKPLVICDGRKITDVVEDKMTAPHVNAVAMTYSLAFADEYKDLMVTTSHLTGKTINRFTSVHQSTDDLVKKVKMLRMIAQKTGTCFQRCVGFDAMNATYATTYLMDQKYGTDYHEKFKKYLIYVQDNDLMIAGSMTDPKGDRSKKPSDQADPDLFVHVVEKRADGIIVRGAKAHQTGMVNSHEMLILPTTALGESDADYAVAAAIPVDAPGVVHIFGRQANDRRRMQDTIDCGNQEFAIVGGETLTILNDVFVPWDRVFMCGEYDFAQSFVETFASYHRQNYGGCKAGLADIMIGASSMMSEYNGAAKASHIKDKLIEMVFLTETMHCCSLACSSEGKQIQSGQYYVDTLYANMAKLNCTRVMYELARISHDITGGLIATMPYEEDIKGEYGPYITKYLAANPAYPTIDRLKMAKLLENMTGGTSLVESMHGAGSPQAMRVMIQRQTDWNAKRSYAKNIAKIGRDE